MAKKILCFLLIRSLCGEKKALCRTWEGNIDTFFTSKNKVQSIIRRQTGGGHYSLVVGIAKPMKCFDQMASSKETMVDMKATNLL